MTTIEWTHRPGTSGVTWNPVTGCSKISEGCKNCYAERMSHRLAGRCGYPEAPHPFDVTLHPDRLDQPLHWRSPRTVFVPSMGDLFHEDVPSDFVDRVISTITRTPRHTYICLTKRASAMAAYFNGLAERIDVVGEWIQLGVTWSPTRVSIRGMWPIKNLWLGVSAENQERADDRIPWLLRTPAAIRLVSLEPMLGRVDMWRFATREETFGSMYDCRSTYGDMYESIGIPSGPPVKYHEGIDWVVCGGESGPGARPMHPDWAGGLRDQCQEADVPFFFKQWGAWWPLREAEGYSVSRDIATEKAKKIQVAAGTPPVSGRIAEMRRVGKKRAGRLLDAREWNEYPEVSDA